MKARKRQIYIDRKRCQRVDVVADNDEFLTGRKRERKEKTGKESLRVRKLEDWQRSRQVEEMPKDKVVTLV